MNRRILEETILDLWRRGLCVWPLWDPKEPERPAKAPRCLGENGVVAITEAACRPTKLETVRLFRKFPRANVGIVNGPKSGVLGVDVDPRNDPPPALVAALEAATPVRTASGRGTGGRHFWFLWTADLDRFTRLFRDRKIVKIAPGIEIPWNLVAPPSVHPEPEVGDGRYREEGGPLRSHGEGKPPPLPETCAFVIEALERALAEDEAPGAGRERVEGAEDPLEDTAWIRRVLRERAEDGSRTERLKSLVAWWVRRGHGLDACTELARAWSDARCAPPFPDGELEEHVAGVWAFARRRQDAEPKVETGGEWPDEVPSWDPPRPELPSAALFADSLAMREVVEVGAVMKRVPPEWVAFPMLSAVAMAAQGRVCLDLEPGWRGEAAPLWTCALGDAARGKTRAFEAFAEPFLRELDDERAKAFGRRKFAARRKLVRLRKRIAELEKDDDESNDDALDEAYAEELSLIADEKAKPRSLQSAGSMEGLRDHGLGTARAALLVGEPEIGRVGWITDEAEIFLAAATSASGNGPANHTVLLRGHTGSFVSVHLVKGEVFIPSFYVTCACLPQPKKLRGLRGGRKWGDSDMEGGGLLSRFLYAWPAPPRVDERPYLPQVRAETRAEVGERLKAIGRMRPGRRCALTDPGWRLVHALMREADERARGGDLQDAPSWAYRMHTHAARLALSLHLISPSWREKEIPVRTVRTACDFLRGYGAAHARMCWRLFDQDTIAGVAQKVWNRLGRLDEFSRGQVTYGEPLPSGAPGLALRAQTADRALALGEARGFWREVKREGRGTKPRTVYVTNPEARERLRRFGR